MSNLTKCGVGAVSAWGDAWSDSGVALIPIVSESITKQIERITDDVLDGNASVRPTERGSTTASGGIEFEIDYNNIGTLLKAAFGNESSGVYTFGNELDEIIRVVIEKTVSRWRVGSAKVNRLSITGDEGQSLRGSVDLVCDDLSRSSDSFPSISFSSRNPVNFSQGVFRFGDLTDALGDADKTAITHFALTIENNLKADDYTSIDASHTDADLIIEPKMNDARSVTLEITMARYAADTWIDYKDNDTALQGDMVFTDGAESLTVELPQMLVTDGMNAPTSGRAIRTLTATMTCFRNVDNTEMAAISNEARVTIA